MGFFSNLMGQKSLGTVTVRFYGEDNASVEYKTEVLDNQQKEVDLIQLFALYYAKMLYNLNRGQSADGLIVYIQKAIGNIINESDGGVSRENILSSNQKLVGLRADGTTKEYSGELFEKPDKMRIVQTHIGIGGEGYYAPTSTIMFFQYLINNLSENYLRFLVLVLSGMNGYYSNSGDYSNMQSINDAPSHGFSFATKILGNK